jgi:hypothetical protein
MNYCGKIQISVGGGLEPYVNDTRQFILAKLLYPEWFRDNVAVVSVFDSFSNLIWQGGRVRAGLPPVSWKDKAVLIESYNKNQIGVHFTFSNNVLAEKHLADQACNEVLKAFNHSLNGVIVSSKILENYVRENYPQYKIIFSLINVEWDKTKLIEAAEKYDLVVIPLEYARDLVFLQKFTNPDKVEILINEPCVPFCPYKKKHYTFLSEMNLGLLPAGKKQDCFVRLLDPEKEQEMMSALRFAELIKIAGETGVTRFKLAQRSCEWERRLCNFQEFFVKPEYQEAFSCYMNGFWQSGEILKKVF